MNWRLSKELRRRGLRDATSLEELGLRSLLDGQLIKTLSEKHEPCTLITWDNKMHLSHAQALDHFGLTLAVIDKDADRGGLADEEYYREVIHRWAHRMVVQEAGAVFKYNRLRHRRVKLKVSVPA